MKSPSITHVIKYLQEKRGYKFLRETKTCLTLLEPGKGFFKMFLFPDGVVKKGNNSINATDVTFLIQREAEIWERAEL